FIDLDEGLLISEVEARGRQLNFLPKGC
ncbi:MAG: hypothetical protein JWN70_6834, partial [Planctomycetaceae bacterium]|nr:hypothetical protein [Planctomycetaceae bacterium]